MISPFAPINLPVLEKQDIEINNNFNDNEEDSDQKQTNDELGEIKITDRRRKSQQTNLGQEKVTGQKRQRNQSIVENTYEQDTVVKAETGSDIQGEPYRKLKIDEAQIGSSKSLLEDKTKYVKLEQYQALMN